MKMIVKSLTNIEKMSKSSEHYKEELYGSLRNMSEEGIDSLYQWKYIGGDKGYHYMALQKSIKNGEVNMNDLPSHQEQCCCSHPIEEQCYVKNIYNEIVLVVGSSCIKRFMNLDMNEEHWKEELKKKTVLDKVGKSFVGFGKYKDKTYEVAFKDDKYCNWVISEDGESKKFINFKEYILSMRKFQK